MMRNVSLSFVILSLFILGPLLQPLPVHAAEEFSVGQKDFEFEDHGRSRKLSTHVWYPARPDAVMSAAKRPGPFRPVVSARNAPLAATSVGRFPVVFLSHGSGGDADGLFWIAEYLVRKGIVVAGVDHPGNRVGDNSADGLMRVWERPRDLSFALDRLAEQVEFKGHLELAKVAAVGHSAGGTTVLLLAGARLSHEKLVSPIPDCAGSKDPVYAAMCDGMKSIDFKKYPKNLVEADLSDQRFKGVVALDPGFARSFSDGSFKHLKAKTIILLAEKLAEPQDEILAKEFVPLLPAGDVQVLPNSYHMTFLQPCQAGIPMGDPELSNLCIESDRRPEIQRRALETTYLFLQKVWAPPKPH